MYGIAAFYGLEVGDTGCGGAKSGRPHGSAVQLEGGRGRGRGYSCHKEHNIWVGACACVVADRGVGALPYPALSCPVSDTRRPQ